MPDDAKKLDEANINRSPGNGAFEVEYLMTKHKLTKQRAINLIDKYGRNRKRIEQVLSAN